MSNNNLNELFNVNDLLIKSRPEQEKALYMEMSKLGRGKPTELVLGAAINVLIAAIRGTSRNKERALQVMESYSQFAKEVLSKHYDGVTGKVFSNNPFTQIIHAAHVDDRDQPYVPGDKK